MTASESLQRLLYLLPIAAREEGVALDEAAQALGVDATTLVKDLDQATERAYYQPAGSVDPFAILIEENRLQVHAPAEFKRPVRLNQREALALGLGLRALAADAEEPRRANLLDLADRLEAELVVPEIELRPLVREALGAPYVAEATTGYGALEVELGADDVRGTLTDAIAARRLCEIVYLKPGEAMRSRRIAPDRLVYAQGNWYLTALDLGAGEARVFRIDRIMDVDVLRDNFTPDERVAAVNAAIDATGSAYLPGDADEQVEVRYSARIARWIAEELQVTPSSDGSLVVKHSVRDPRWLVRHVLQYGGDAVVSAPPYREMVAAAVARVAAGIASRGGSHRR